MDHAGYMKKALHLASLTNWAILGGRVGSVVVSDGDIIGGGYKQFAAHYYGDSDYDRTVLHAERVAIENSGERAYGATIYTTLEPCMPLDHEGNGDFPSCSDLIVSRGIRRVIFGMPDPNPDINGRGREYLERQGIEVVHLSGFEDMISPLLRSYDRRSWKATRGRSKDWRYRKPYFINMDRDAHRRIVRMREEIAVNELLGELVC